MVLLITNDGGDALREVIPACKSIWVKHSGQAVFRDWFSLLEVQENSKVVLPLKRDSDTYFAPVEEEHLTCLFTTAVLRLGS